MNNVAENKHINMGIPLGLTLRGEFTIEVRDAKTMEIKRVIKEENTPTSFLYKRWLDYESIFPNTNVSPVYPQFTSPRTLASIYLSNRKLSPVMSLYRMGFGVASTTGLPYYASQDTQLEFPTWFPGVPDYMEIKGRFNQPTVTRTINSIFVGDSTSINADDTMVAYAALVTPCTQTTTEVLDVTYRIQSFYQASAAIGLPTSDQYGPFLARAMLTANRSDSVPQRNVTERGISTWSKVPPLSTYRLSLIPSDTPNSSYSTSDAFTALTSYYQHWKSIHQFTLTTAQQIGRCMSSVVYGGFTFLTLDSRGGVAWAPFVSSSFVGSGRPIQPIHNHNANAIEPFLDVDFLATSQGFITVFGAGWTNPDYPEMYRIEYINSGALGTGRYFFRKRNIIRFRNTANATTSSYDVKPERIIFRHRTIAGNQTPISTVHGYDTPHILEYNTKKIINQSVTGITIFDLVDATIRTFDASSTPVLTATNIRQVAVDDFGNIWVADAAQGLRKIADPFGVPVITQITNATNGIVAGSDNTCYAVAPGFNGSIWAVFNGGATGAGLSRTDNPNAATPTFTNFGPLTGTVFSFTGITDNNWANVSDIHTDRQSSSHQLALTSFGLGTGGTRKIIWWSTLTTALGATTECSNFIDSLKCSRFGGSWAFNTVPSPTVNELVRITFNALTGTPIENTNSNAVGSSKPTFFYDYYNVPHIVGDSTSGPFRHNSLVTPEGRYVADIQEVAGVFITSESLLSFESNTQRKGILIYDTAGSFDAQGLYMITLAPDSPLNTGANYCLNARYSPFEEAVWERYHWNGSAWILNYYAQATDTSGLSVHANRSNFDTESHTFTGRSLVDATAAFPSGTFAASAASGTFAFYITPTAKPGGATPTTPATQEFQRVLLSIEDTTQKFRVIWSNSATASIGSVAIETHGATHVVAATPADNGTYRVVVTISGTSVNVYSNNVQLGSLVTLTGVGTGFNWSNTSGTLKAYVGASVYSNFLAQRHTPTPNNFYRGAMTNVQFWTGVWNATDRTSDNTAPTGVIGSPSSGAAVLKARYQLTQSLAGLETKPTHGSIDALFNGINIRFSAGMSGTDFVTGDYLTFGVVDGILKDNAIAITQKYSLYQRPVDLLFTEFKNNSNTNTIPGTTAAVIERAVFSLDRATNISTPPDSVVLSTRPGQIASNSATGGIGFNANIGGITSQGLTGNGYFQFKVGSSNENLVVGLTSTPLGNNNANQTNFALRFNINGTVDVRELDVIPSGGTGVSSYVSGDEFRVERSGTTITYKKITGGPTTVFTSTVSSSGTIHGRFVGNVGSGADGRGSCIWNATISYIRPLYFMTVGNLSTTTGSLHPEFLSVDTEEPQTISISLNAVPISASNIVISNTYQGNMTSPGPGQVVINGETGWLVFNAADSGKAVTGAVTVIYNKLP